MEKLDYKKLERTVKGFANHWRIKVMELLAAKPELSVAEMADDLEGDFKNISAHVSKLAIAGLVMKRYEGNNVRHKLTEKGRSILKFITTLNSQ